MNYYEKHIGDYLKDTAHLSLLEHGIYSRLLDIYYSRESAIPMAQVMRLVGARTDEECSAVRDVLNEFFQLDGDVYRHNRCDREIARYVEKSKKAAASASARWAKPESHSDGNANAVRTHSERSAKAMLPVTSNQTPVVNTKDIEPTALVVSPSAKRLPACPTDQLVGLYHRHLPTLPIVEIVSDGRKRALAARWREVVADHKDSEDPRAAAIDWFDWYFSHAAKSAFLTGRAKDWRADFDFLITPRKFVKVVEGHYHLERV